MHTQRPNMTNNSNTSRRLQDFIPCPWIFNQRSRWPSPQAS
uniref:Uncharacterized protein n=1 Tax=Arundo donax TaxID=35708 RepID=A0A0A8ZBM3_ARUDO